MSDWQLLDLEQATVEYCSEFFDRVAATRYLNYFIESVPWKQDTFKFSGREVRVPRLTQWYGEPGKSYTYSGIKNEPLPWSDVLLEIKKPIEEILEQEFNSVLLNYYRDGKDSVGWHADDEKELGDQPCIASLSLGSSRNFELKHKLTGKHVYQTLNHGDLLVMSGSTQQYWKHQIPKVTSSLDSRPRINLTFRNIVK